MSPSALQPYVTSVEPLYACEGGRVTVHGRDLWTGEGQPELTLGDVPVRVSAASPTTLTFRVPHEVAGGTMPIGIAGSTSTAFLEVARRIATGLHQVDSPAFDQEGRLYVTYSGSRGQQVPVSIFRVTRSGARESFSSAIVNPTAMAIGPDGDLYVSSRFEGNVYRVAGDGTATVIATELGVPCGLTFSPQGALFVGDRSGTIFRIRKGGQPLMVATVPSSVAAFHLAMGPDGWIYVTAPTLTSYDRIYRVHPDGRTEVAYSGFGRPQGLAFDPKGVLHVVEALAGASGLYRVGDDGVPQLVVSGEGLVGVAFDPLGGMVLSSNDTVYRFDSQPSPTATPGRH
jgi:sugar lactone lactonase YvrE